MSARGPQVLGVEGDLAIAGGIEASDPRQRDHVIDRDRPARAAGQSQLAPVAVTLKHVLAGLAPGPTAAAWAAGLGDLQPNHPIGQAGVGPWAARLRPTVGSTAGCFGVGLLPGPFDLRLAPLGEFFRIAST